MNNTLYIGPYKNKNIVSLSSLDIIDCLNNDQRVSGLSIRPIYLNDNILDSQNLIISNLEKTKYLENYDTIIQHGPAKLLVDTLPFSAKNIAIPLLDKIYNRQRYIESLVGFDTILVDSEEYYDFLTNGYGFKNVKIFDYYRLYHNTKTLDFSANRLDKKVYYIGFYDSNLIDKIIKSFYLAANNRDDMTLMLFINQPPESIGDDMNKKIQDIQKSLNIHSINDNINMFFKYFDLEEIVSIHNTCDIYLDLANHNSDSAFNRYLAKNKNKKIIDQMTLNTYNEFAYSKSGYIYPETINDFSCSSLAESIILSLNNNDTQYRKYPNIVETICQ